MNNNSGTNTIILVLILGLIIFGMVWFFKGNSTQEQPDNGLNVELNIPSGSSENSGGESN